MSMIESVLDLECRILSIFFLALERTPPEDFRFDKVLDLDLSMVLVVWLREYIYRRGGDMYR